MSIEMVGLDADDTLWHNEGHFSAMEQRFCDLMAPWGDPESVSAALLAKERENLTLLGYGGKAFTLSIIETAVEISSGEIDGERIGRIVKLGKDLLRHPVELLDGVPDAIHELERDYRLVLVTKGDINHQKSKLVRSGLVDLFERVDIVAEKDPPTYARLLNHVRVKPQAFCMIGNSVRSDILPVLEIGGSGVHVPYHTTWELEQAEVEEDHPDIVTVQSILEAPVAVRALAARRG